MPNPVQLAFRSSVPAPTAARGDNSGGGSFPEIMQLLGAPSPKPETVGDTSQKTPPDEKPGPAVSGEGEATGQKSAPGAKTALSGELIPGTDSSESQSPNTVAPRRQRHAKPSTEAFGTGSEQSEKRRGLTTTLASDMTGPIVIPVQVTQEVPSSVPPSAVTQRSPHNSKGPLSSAYVTTASALRSVDATPSTSVANVGGTSATPPTSAPISQQQTIPVGSAGAPLRNDPIRSDIAVDSPTASRASSPSPNVSRANSPEISNENTTVHAPASSAAQPPLDKAPTKRPGAPRSANPAEVPQNFAMARMAYASMSQPRTRDIAPNSQAPIQSPSGVSVPLGIPQARIAGNSDSGKQAFRMPPEFAASAQISIDQAPAIDQTPLVDGSSVPVEFHTQNTVSATEIPASVPVGSAVKSAERAQPQRAQGIAPRRTTQADLGAQNNTLPTSSATSSDSSTPITSANEVPAETDRSESAKVDSQQVSVQASVAVPHSSAGAAKQKDRVNNVAPSAIPSSQDRNADRDSIASAIVSGQVTRETLASQSIPSVLPSGQSAEPIAQEASVADSATAAGAAANSVQTETRHVADRNDQPARPKRSERIEASSPRASETRNTREVGGDDVRIDKPVQRVDSAPEVPPFSPRVADIPQSSAHIASSHPAQNAASSMSVSQSSVNVERAHTGGTAEPSTAPSPAHTSPQPERAYTLVETARLVERASATEMRVGVHTPELGKVEVHASLRDNTLGATLSVERPEIQRMFASELPNLNRALDRHQVELQSVSLMDSSMQQAGSQGKQDQQQAPQKQSWPQAAESAPRATESRPGSTRASEVRSSQWGGSGLDLLA